MSRRVNCSKFTFFVISLSTQTTGHHLSLTIGLIEGSLQDNSKAGHKLTALEMYCRAREKSSCTYGITSSPTRQLGEDTTMSFDLVLFGNMFSITHSALPKLLLITVLSYLEAQCNYFLNYSTSMEKATTNYFQMRKKSFSKSLHTNVCDLESLKPGVRPV